MNLVAVLIVTQLLFTVSDVLARQQLHRHGFNLGSFLNLWFAVYVMIRIIATGGQLYVLSNVKVGQTMALFGAVSIVLSNVIGFLWLRETLSLVTYLGIILAIFAFLLLAVRTV